MFEITIVLFVFLFFNIKSDKCLDVISKRIILIYVLLWGFVISVSSLGVYGLFVPSLEVRIMSIVHVFTFVIGYRMIKISKNEIKSFDLDKLNRGLDKLTNSIIFKIISWVLACYIGMLVVRFLEILATANLADMHVIAAERHSSKLNCGILLSIYKNIINSIM